MFLLGATLALGFSFASYLIANAVRTINDESGIRVKGYAEMPVQSDMAAWTIRVRARAAELRSGYDTIGQSMDLVRRQLVAYGFTPQECAPQSVSVSETYTLTERGVRTNVIDHYQLSQDMFVVSDKVQLVASSSKQITELMAQGVHIVSHGPSFTFNSLDQLKIDLLGRAAANAAERATTMASKAGSQVGPVRSASQGVFQIVPRGSTETASYGRYDTSTIAKVVKAVVTIEFTVQ